MDTSLDRSRGGPRRRMDSDDAGRCADIDPVREGRCRGRARQRHRKGAQPAGQETSAHPGLHPDVAAAGVQSPPAGRQRRARGGVHAHRLVPHGVGRHDGTPSARVQKPAPPALPGASARGIPARRDSVTPWHQGPSGPIRVDLRPDAPLRDAQGLHPCATVVSAVAVTDPASAPAVGSLPRATAHARSVTNDACGQRGLPCAGHENTHG